MNLSLKFKSLINFTPTWSIFQRVDKSQRNAPELIEYISCFRCNDVDNLLIKFEPTGEFNFEEQFYVFQDY